MSTATPHAHDHDHAHDHTRDGDCCDVGGMAKLGQSDGEHKLDLQIIAVLLGVTVLIASFVSMLIYPWVPGVDGHTGKEVMTVPVQSAMLAMVASLLLGGPIVWGAAKGLITGKCSHDHGPGHLHDHEGHEHVAGGSHMEELVALAIIAAFAAGMYVECAVVAFFMLIASLIEHRTAAGALKTIESLIRITPTKAVLLTDSGEQEVPAADLKPGDRVLVLPGDNIPGDGKVVEGNSTVDQANITGESVPVEKAPGDEAFAGTINETGRLVIEISRAGEDSTLGKVQSLILQAAQSKSAVVRELSKYASYYTPVVIILAFIIFVFTQDLRDSISLLLIACPCALILCGPTAIVAALSASARLGVLVKSVSDLEVVRRVTAIVFDKTGTLTTGDLSVTRMKPIDGVEGAELLRLCVSAEVHSRHPVARAVVEVAEKAKLQPTPTQHFEEVSGRGVKATLEDGSIVLVGI